MSEHSFHRRAILGLVPGLVLAVAAAPALAAPELDAPAPPFKAADEAGRTWSLDELKGKIVVLEWTSDFCPYSHKHYDSGNMQRLQRRARKQGVVWLTVMTAAPGSSEYLGPEKVRAWKRRVRSAAAAVLLDPSAELARAYEAKTTPHMFVIDRAGRLAYMGGIDDRPYADPASLKGARNYVALALDALEAGRPIADRVTRPYGCSIKYPSA